MDKQLMNVLDNHPITCAVAFRLFNACCSTGFFQPDEYWQTLEVAHRIVYGTGFETWEWRTDRSGMEWSWKEIITTGGQGGIRSPLYPSLFIPVYWALHFTGLDKTFLLTLAPRLLQALISAATDLSLRRIATKALGPRYSSVALLCSLTSFFHFHASTRTFSNTMEMSLSTFALETWPWHWIAPEQSESKKENDQHSGSRAESTTLMRPLAFAALATVMRPSNAVIWLILGLNLLMSTTRRNRTAIVRQALLIGVSTSMLCFIADTIYYDTPTFTPIRFLYSNVYQSISLFYGANASHFYLTQAVPILLMTQMPFTLQGIYVYFGRTTNTSDRFQKCHIMRALGCTVFGTITCYSVLPHKEWRFIYPLLPVLHLFAAASLFELSRIRKSHDATSPVIRRTHLLLLLSSLPLAFCFTALHCQGQSAVMPYLRETVPVGGTIGFLMPCHSTPWQSALHRSDLEPSGYEGKLWFIGCEPPVLGQDPTSYLDESDIFYADPVGYIRSHLGSYPTRSDSTEFAISHGTRSAERNGAHSVHTGGSSYQHAWPSHLVVFGALLDERSKEDGESVADLLGDEGYVVRRRLWNGLGGWHEDERRRGHVVVLERSARRNDRWPHRHDRVDL